jgi:hypothetical protein
MKNIRTLLIAVSALVLVNVAQAQTPSPANENATYSTDPMVQKRQDDSVAKAEYKARKKAARQKMRAEKKAAKAELKAEKAESTEIRNTALAAEPLPKN